MHGNSNIKFIEETGFALGNLESVIGQTAWK